MTDPVKWALIDILKLMNSAHGAQHEKLEGIAATLGVDIHHSRPSGEWPSGFPMNDIEKHSRNQAIQGAISNNVVRVKATRV